jgi:hypothetical protein
VLVIDSFIEPDPLGELPDNVPPEDEDVQAKVAPATFEVGTKDAVAVPQPVVVVITFVTVGPGLTTTE